MSHRQITVREITEIASYITVIVGGIFAIWQYMSLLHQERVKETLNYEKRLYEGEFFRAKSKIERAWFEQQEFFEQLRHTKVKSKAERDKIVSYVSSSIIEKNRLESDIDILCDFYNSLSLCVQEHICDKETTLSFFKPYATKFYNLHRFYILKRKKDINDYAKGLEYIVKGGNKQ